MLNYVMQDFKKGLLSFRHGVSLCEDEYPKTTKKKDRMKAIPYALIVGSLMYAMLYTRSNICFFARMVSRHWMVVKHILNYL